jgi:hypothetical protein
VGHRCNKFVALIDKWAYLAGLNIEATAALKQIRGQVSALKASGQQQSK